MERWEREIPLILLNQQHILLHKILNQDKAISQYSSKIPKLLHLGHRCIPNKKTSVASHIFIKLRRCHPHNKRQYQTNNKLSTTTYHRTFAHSSTLIQCKSFKGTTSWDLIHRRNENTSFSLFSLCCQTSYDGILRLYRAWFAVHPSYGAGAIATDSCIMSCRRQIFRQASSAT